jgi:hypothetical protein
MGTWNSRNGEPAGYSWTFGLPKRIAYWAVRHRETGKYATMRDGAEWVDDIETEDEIFATADIPEPVPPSVVLILLGGPAFEKPTIEYARALARQSTWMIE